MRGRANTKDCVRICDGHLVRPCAFTVSVCTVNDASGSVCCERPLKSHLCTVFVVAISVIRFPSACRRTRPWPRAIPRTSCCCCRVMGVCSPCWWPRSGWKLPHCMRWDDGCAIAIASGGLRAIDSGALWFFRQRSRAKFISFINDTIQLKMFEICLTF